MFIKIDFVNQNGIENVNIIWNNYRKNDKKNYNYRLVT